MIKFTNPKLFLKGTSEAMLTDKASGNIVYWSDKFQTANVQSSVTLGDIRAGLGNAIAAMIPSDAALQVNFAAADFSLFAKAAQAGATLSYGAPTPVCQTVAATGTSLTVSLEQGTPVAQLGMSKVLCYVQAIGSASPLEQGGIAYPLNPVTGAVVGFNAVAGTEYLVWYFVNKAGSQLATIQTNMDPKVLHFTASMAVYANEGGSTNSGTRAGTLYVVVPSLKLAGDGAGVTGDQTTPDTSSISGQALAFDPTVITGGCADCGGNGSVLAYYLYVPCDGGDSIQGLALPGGVITVPVSSTHTINEFMLVMADNSLTRVDNATATYTLTTPPTGTTVEGAVLTTGVTAGDCDITAKVTIDGKEYSCPGTLSVVEAS